MQGFFFNVRGDLVNQEEYCKMSCTHLALQSQLLGRRAEQAEVSFFEKNGVVSQYSQVQTDFFVH